MNDLSHGALFICFVYIFKQLVIIIIIIIIIFIFISFI